MGEDNKKVTVEFSAEGTVETSKAVDGVTESLQRQVKTQQMIANTSADIQRRNRINALKDEAKEVNNVAAAFRTLGTNVTPANDVVQKATFQFGALRGSLGAGTALLGNLGRSFTSIVPAAGGFIEAISTGGHAFSQFLGLLGGGPGIVAGGVVAAVGLMVTAFANAKEEAAKLAEETKKNAEALKEYLAGIEGIRTGVADRFSKAKGARDYETRFQAGDLSSEEYAAERQAAKELAAHRDEINQRRMAAAASGDTDSLRTLSGAYISALKAPARAEQARLLEQKAREREAQEKANAAAKLDIEAQAAEKAAAEEAKKEAQEAALKKANTKHGFGFVDPDVVQGQIRALEKMQQDYRDRQQALQDEALHHEANAQADRIEKEHLARVRALDAEEAIRKEKYDRESAQDEARAQKHLNALRERNKAYTDTLTTMGQIGASTTIKMFSDLAKGHKLAIGAVLEGIGDQMVAEGTRVLFQAAAFAFIPGMQVIAPGLAAVGAAEVAAGIGLGAAGARGEGGSSSGGGGASQPTTNYADPFAHTAQPGGGVGGPTIINVNFPTVLSPSAVDGARIQLAVRKAQNVYG